jgi:two-component system cell cycle sensor histidine kinase/response regulator CckA
MKNQSRPAQRRGRPAPARGKPTAEQAELAALQIAEASQTAASLQELLGAIHRIVGELMPVPNLYVALHEPETGQLSFPYWADEQDPRPAPRELQRGLAEYVLRTGTLVHATPEAVARLAELGEVELAGTPAADWLGAPLVEEGRTVGVLAVQSYRPGVRYHAADERVLRFVSTQVAMAIRRHRMEDALRESDARFRLLTENITEVFFIADPATGRTTYVSPAYEEIHGRPRDTAYAAPMAWLETVHAEDRERMRAFTRRVDAHGNAGGETCRIARPDGTVRWVRTRVFPIKDEAGRVIHVVGVTEDVTDRHAAEAQLRQAQKMEAVGQLSSGIAHDFNNLLTTVLATCELLEAELPADDPCRAELQTIRGAALRGADLTRKLLAFSRQAPLTLRPTQLGPLVEGFAKRARGGVPEGVTITARVDAAVATVPADAGAVEQMLTNLVANARDAMASGGAILIEVGDAALDEEHCRTYGWGEPGNYVVASVSDTGTGMDAETQRRIYEPFFTTKPVGRGTGLGMAMVYGLMKQHRGFVHVFSEPGHGTTVRLYFPAVAADPAPRPVAGDLEAPRGTETVLVVEDDDALRRLTARVLGRHGYTVLMAADGGDALRLLAAPGPPPDLMISDVVMPGISGPQLLQMLRESGRALKTLFVSGYTARDLSQRATLGPDQPFLAKPWTVPELLRKVRMLLDTPIA